MVPASPQPYLVEPKSLECSMMTEASWDKVAPDVSECKAFNCQYYAADDVAQLYTSARYDVGCLYTPPKNDTYGHDVRYSNASNKGRRCPNGSEKSGNGKNFSSNNSSGQESHGGDNSGQQPPGSNGGGFGAGGDGNGDDPNRGRKPPPEDALEVDSDENDNAEEDPFGSPSQSDDHGRANAKRPINDGEPSISSLEPEPKKPRSNYLDNPADDRDGTVMSVAQATGLSTSDDEDNSPASSIPRSPLSPSHSHPESHSFNSPTCEPVPTDPEPPPLPSQNNDPVHCILKATVSDPLSKHDQPGTSAGGGQHSTIDCFIDSSGEEKEVTNDEDQIREHPLNVIPAEDVEMAEILKPSNDCRTHDETQPGSEVNSFELELRRTLSSSSSDDSDDGNATVGIMSPEARMNAVDYRYYDITLSSDEEMEHEYGNNERTDTRYPAATEIEDQNGHWDPGKQSSSSSELSDEEDMDCNLDRPGTSGLQACVSQDDENCNIDCDPDRPEASGLRSSRRQGNVLDSSPENVPTEETVNAGILNQEPTQTYPVISAFSTSTSGIHTPSFGRQRNNLASRPRLSPVSAPTINDPSWRLLVDNRPPPPGRIARHCDSCAEDIVTDSGEFGVSGTFTCGRCVVDEINEVRVNMMRGRPRRDRVFYDPPLYLFQPGPTNRAFIQRHVDRRVRRTCNLPNCLTEVWTSEPLYCPDCGRFFCHPACRGQHNCRNRTFRDDD